MCQCHCECLTNFTNLVLAAGDLVGAGQEEDGAEAHEPEGGEHQQDERSLPRPGRKQFLYSVESGIEGSIPFSAHYILCYPSPYRERFLSNLRCSELEKDRTYP